MKKVLIASPLRQNAAILEEFLSNLTRLNIPTNVYVEQYYLINSCDEAVPIVEKYGHKYDVIELNNTYGRSAQGEHIWDASSLQNISSLRNACIKYAIKHNFDYIWFIDTDIIVHPDTLRYLLELKVPLVSEIMWTKSEIGIWCNGNPYCYHMLDSNQEDMQRQIDSWQYPGLYKAGYTGANFLISKEVLDAGIDYSPISNFSHTYHGEDRSFCCKALARGYDVLIDTHYPAVHLYNEEKFNIFINNKENVLKYMLDNHDKPLYL